MYVFHHNLNLKDTRSQLVSIIHLYNNKLLTAELQRFSNDKKDVVRGFAANSQNVHTKKQYPEIKQAHFNSMILSLLVRSMSTKSDTFSLDSGNVKMNQTIQSIIKSNCKLLRRELTSAHWSYVWIFYLRMGWHDVQVTEVADVHLPKHIVQSNRIIVDVTQRSNWKEKTQWTWRESKEWHY